MSISRQPFFLQILATTDRIFLAEYFLGENFSSRPAPTFPQLDHAEKHARNLLCKLTIVHKGAPAAHPRPTGPENWRLALS